MKKALQFSALLLFTAVLTVALSPAFVPSAHANATILGAASGHSAAYSAQATSPTPQSQPAAQPQAQTPPPNNQNPNPGAPHMQGQRLPPTASPLPELALIGFLSLLGIVVIRKVASNLI